MSSSTRSLVRLDLAVTAFVLTFCALAWTAIEPVGAQGYSAGPPSPAMICGLTSESELNVLERSLSPPGGETETAGTPVTLSGDARSPVMFAVASSPALLSDPDIDGGPASAVPISSGPSPIYTYTFTLTKATATLGTIYWAASFSTANLVECAGQPQRTYVTHAHMLTVLPAPMPSSSPTPAPTPSPAVSPLVQVSIGVPNEVHLTHSSVIYRVRCTTNCSGEISARALVVRGHGKVGSAPTLDIASEPMSITTAAGGEEQFTHHYDNKSLRILRAIARTGDVLELRITVKVSGSSGNVVWAMQTIQLRT